MQNAKVKTKRALSFFTFAFLILNFAFVLALAMSARNAMMSSLAGLAASAVAAAVMSST
jgi:hypothetical protein